MVMVSHDGHWQPVSASRQERRGPDVADRVGTQQIEPRPVPRPLDVTWPDERSHVPAEPFRRPDRMHGPALDAPLVGLATRQQNVAIDA